MARPARGSPCRSRDPLARIAARTATAKPSISSPIQRASSSPSQCPIRRTFLAFTPHQSRASLPRRPLVAGDHVRGGGQNMRGRAVILLKPHHVSAPGKSFSKPQDVSHLCPAPAIDGLIIVANAADVLVPARPKGAATGTARHSCPDIRRRECSANQRWYCCQNILMRLKDRDHVQQKIAKIHRIEFKQSDRWYCS